MERVLICGNCAWTDAGPIFDVLYGLKEEIGKDDITVVVGMAPGADVQAWYCAHALDLDTDDYPANHKGHEKILALMGEGYKRMSRNQWMLDSGVDMCYAFAYDLLQPSGTQDMVNRCIDHGDIPIYWFDGYKMRLVSDGDRTDNLSRNTKLDSMQVIQEVV